MISYDLFCRKKGKKVKLVLDIKFSYKIQVTWEETFSYTHCDTEIRIARFQLILARSRKNAYKQHLIPLTLHPSLGEIAAVQL